MEIADPTEFEVAEKLLGSWEHWERLLKCSWFKPYVEAWRRELKMRLDSEYRATMMGIANDPKARASDRASALKWLHQQLGPKKRASTRGRPSKDEIEGELKAALEESEHFTNDAQRLGLN